MNSHRQSLQRRTAAGSLCLALLLAVVPAGRAEESDDSIVTRARAAYHENIRRLGVFRCTTQKEEAYTRDYYDALQQRIARIEKALPGLAPDPRKEAEELLRQDKAFLASRVNYPRHTAAAFVIGSTALQVVVPGESPLPDVPLTRQADLPQSFSGCHVLSWSAMQQPASWLWQGDGRWRDKRYNAVQSPKRPQDALNFPVIPVGAACRTFFEPERLSPFDELFETTAGEIRVLGREQVEGWNLLIVERTRAVPEYRMSVKAWLSVEHGHFPVRIEYKACRRVDSLEEVEPRERIDVSGFFRTGSGAFYPLGWTIESKVDDDRTAAMRVPNRRPPYVQYTERRETWKVSRIQSRQPEPTLLSEIRFPDGTSCWDEERGVRFTVGAPQ